MLRRKIVVRNTDFFFAFWYIIFIQCQHIHILLVHDVLTSYQLKVCMLIIIIGSLLVRLQHMK